MAISFAAVLLMTPVKARSAPDESVPVTVHNFGRAETDLYFSGMVKDGGLGKLQGAYSLNNMIAKPNGDGSIGIQFGGCGRDTVNCLPIMSGWNYTARLYRPRKDVLEERWAFPEAEPAN
jgi:hypothetical protein